MTRRLRRKRAPKFSHRTHPAKLFKAPPGVCQWCASDIVIAYGTINANSKFCGRLCEDAYRVHTNPKIWRREVFRRCLGICQECGIKHSINGKTWEADHIQPLFIAFNDWNFWSPENGAVLCKKPCHEKKTEQDRIRFSVPRKNHRKQKS